MSTKKRITLTMAPEKRLLAEQLAKRKNRSLSNLFETLVDEEWERTERVSEEEEKYKTSKKTKKKGQSTNTMNGSLGNSVTTTESYAPPAV